MKFYNNFLLVKVQPRNENYKREIALSLLTEICLVLSVNISVKFYDNFTKREFIAGNKRSARMLE